MEAFDTQLLGDEGDATRQSLDSIRNSPLGTRPADKSETHVDPEDVSMSYHSILSAFKKLPPSPEPTVDVVDKFLRGDKKLEEQDLSNVREAGSDEASFLHFLFKKADSFKERLPLIRWVMEKHPDLYLKGVEDNKSILQVLATRSKAAEVIQSLSQFVELFPTQVADILKRTETKNAHQGRLLSNIIPAIWNSATPDFLKFFGECSDDAKPTQCTCYVCSENTALLTVNNHDSHSLKENKHPSLPLGNEITSEEIGDVMILRWPKEMSDRTTPSLQSKSEVATHPGIISDANGQTPLHLAAAYRDCADDDRIVQFRLVKHLFSWCPEALEKVNKAGQSAYLHRIAGPCQNAGRPQQGEDDIAFYLKDQIMHLPDRDDVLDLLYGRSRGAQLSSLPGSSGSEREIHLDLRELQRSASSSATKDDLLAFIDGLRFESILQYVQIPQYPFRIRRAPSRSSTADVTEAKHEKTGTGRKDFADIFDVLKKKDVRKIHRLVVDDDDTCLHEDETIERLSHFEIEEFQWKKLDLSSSVLRHAVPYVRTLRLFSSGNHSVLRDWSSADGLNQLSLLSSVYLKIYWKTESRERTAKYAKDFVKRIIASSKNIKTVEVRLEPFTAKNYEEWPNRHLLVATNKWLQTMQKFASFVNNIRNQPGGGDDRDRALEIPQEVRVAILDDGIDWSFAKQIGCTGMSFYPDKSSHFEGHNVWYSSSTDHGTLMAALIEKMCPDVKLYIARLDQTESEQSEFQPTPESAAKAIQWAIQKDVHIISMSWTIPGQYECLDMAINKARERNILMFGSASDQGARDSNLPYMAKLANKGQGPVICIGGAREFGLADERARSEGEFFFPGQTNGIPPPLPPLKRNFDAKTGSSVATALAAGFTALIMLLVDMSPKYGGIKTAGSGSASQSESRLTSVYRKQLQDPMHVRKLFESLLHQSEINTSNAELRNHIIIPADTYFDQNRLMRQLSKVPVNQTAEKGRELLDGILERVLRVLINSYADRKFEYYNQADMEDE
ncbi:hypothetical protein GGR58DRAFT_229212 [Xylaria digitata]|nr:hypothetical protein GGR58DRAFT_229212 [Xylaria digitata]